MTISQTLFFKTIPSTNLEAKSKAHEGCPHGTVVWALEQTAGYGKYGRHWVSKPGNLYLSLVLRPEKKLDEAAQITFIASLAVGAFLESVLPKNCQFGYKWPNDFLIDYAKTGGVILESDQKEGEAYPFIVVGIGLNLKHHPENMPYKTTSLFHYGIDVEPEIAMEQIVKHFFNLYALWMREGFVPIKTRFEEKILGAGEHHMFVFEHGKKETQRRLCGLDERGGLIVEDQSRKKETLYAGDIFFAKQKVKK